MMQTLAIQKIAIIGRIIEAEPGRALRVRKLSSSPLVLKGKKA
jgi:hypothetical protein